MSTDSFELIKQVAQHLETIIKKTDSLVFWPITWDDSYFLLREFFKTAVKGTIAEDEIADALRNYLKSRKINDSISLSGTEMAQGSNKTSDIVCKIATSDGKIRLLL